MLQINGKEENNLIGLSLSEALDQKGFHIKQIAVELNGEVIPKSKFASQTLQDGDNIEVVTFVRGG